MARAIFSGAISFGLVHIPIKIYSATESKGIKLHMLCPECHSPLEYKRWCPKCQKEVSWQNIEKGFKISKDKYVILKKEDLEKIKLPTSKTIDIKTFVDISQIDPILFEKSYFVVPSEGGEKPYSLFVEALRLSNKAAIGKVVMRQKEYLVALRPFKKGIVMHVLYYLEEVKDIEKLPELEKLVVVSKEELELAKALIENLTQEEFDLSKFKDEYAEALKELIKAKMEGREFSLEKKKGAEEAKSLMEMLKASVESVEKKKKKEE
ncbi:MAG: Ku protein [Candidatus Aenigmatarchaeota archaeon]